MINIIFFVTHNVMNLSNTYNYITASCITLMQNNIYYQVLWYYDNLKNICFPELQSTIYQSIKYIIFW